MEKETDPNPTGFCEKIFNALSNNPAFRPIRRLTNATNSTAPAAPTTAVDKPTETDKAPPKHIQAPPPPPLVAAAPPALPENKVVPKVDQAQPTIQLQDKARPAGDDKAPTKTIPAPPQEKLQPTYVKEQAVPMGPTAPVPPKKETTPVMVEQPTIPAAPPVLRPAAPPVAQPMPRPVAVAPPAVQPVRRPVAVAPTAAPPVPRPVLVSNERAPVAAKVDQQVMGKERERVGARAEPPAVPLKAGEKGQPQRPPTKSARASST